MRRERGFSLVEALVVMSVLAVMMYAVVAIFGGVARQWNAQAGRSKAIESANLAISKMAQEISEASVYNTVDGLVNNSFTMPKDIDASGDYLPVWSGPTLFYNPGSHVQFYLAAADGISPGTILWRRYQDQTSGKKTKKGGKPKNGLSLIGAGWESDPDWSRIPGSTTRGQVENVTSLIFLRPMGIANVVTIQLTVTWPEGPKSYSYTVQRDVYLTNHN